MRTDTLTAVSRAVEQYPSLTAKEYSDMTDLSIGTVYRALEKIHAQPVGGTYPVQWIPAPDGSNMPLYVDENGNLVARMGNLPKPPNPGQFSDTQTLQDASHLAQSIVTSGKLNLNLELGTDLNDYRRELGRYASHIMTMLWHVDALLGKPEWKIKAGLIPDITKKEQK